MELEECRTATWWRNGSLMIYDVGKYFTRFTVAGKPSFCHRVVCLRDGLRLEIFSPRLPKEATVSLWFHGMLVLAKKNWCSTSASLLVSPCFLIKSTENRNFSRAQFVIESTKLSPCLALQFPPVVVTSSQPSKARKFCIAMTIWESLTSLQPVEWKFAPPSVHNAKLSYHRKHKFETTLCH